MADGGSTSDGSTRGVPAPGTTCTGTPTPAGATTSPSRSATLPVPTPPSSASLRIRVAVDGQFCSLLEGKHSDGKCNGEHGEHGARRMCPCGLVDLDWDVGLELDSDLDLDLLVPHFDRICP